MELTKELVEAHKLTPEAVKALQEFGAGVIATEKNAIESEWKEKANKDAEGILSGAAAKVEEVTKIKRNQGEKIADYLQRTGSEFLSSQKSELEKLKSDYEAKIKDVKGVDVEAIRKQYEAEKDGLLQKYADYDELKEKAANADKYGQELSGLKLDVAYNNVKPNFPDTANKYEVAAKWDEFKKSISEKYTIEIVDGIPKAVDKENKYKIVNLAELVEKHEPFAELLTGRQQSGTGGKQVKMTKVEGVDFEVPVNADNVEITKLVREHLVKKGLQLSSKEYSSEFKVLFEKIKKRKTAA